MAQEQELFSIGPFGGLDTTSSLGYVADNDAVDMQNVVPYRVSGAYHTAQGRSAVTISGSPGSNFGLTKCNASTYPYLIGFVSATNTLNLYSSTTPLNPTLQSILLPATQSITYSTNTSLFTAFYNGKSYSAVGLRTSAGWVWYDYNSGSGVGANTCSFMQAPAPTAAPTIAANGAGVLTGTYYYRVTYSGNNKETSPGPVSPAFTASSNTVRCTLPSTSSDPQMTQYNIYRLGGSLGGQWFLVGTTAFGNTVFDDNTPDASVTGQSLVLHRDPPPTVGIEAVVTHKERVWVLTSLQTAGSGSKNAIYYSNYAEPWGFDTTNQVLPFSGGDSCVSAVPLGSILLVLKSESTHAVYGDSQQDFVTRKLFDIGCVSAQTVCVGAGGVFWLSTRGPIFFDGTTPQNISDGISADFVKTTGVATSASAFMYGDCYCLSFPLSGGVTYCYHIPSRKWHKLGFSDSKYIYDLESAPSTTMLNEVYGYVGSINQWFSSETDLGSQINANFTSKISSCGSDGYTKQFTKLVLTSPSPPNSSVAVTVTADGASFGTNISMGNKTRAVVTLPPKMIGDTVQVKIATATTAATQIQGVSILGRVKRAAVPVGTG